MLLRYTAHLPANGDILKCRGGVALRKIWQCPYRSQELPRLSRQPAPTEAVLATALLQSSDDETSEDNTDARELQDSSREALRCVLELLCSATLVAGFAFELFGARQCWNAAAMPQRNVTSGQWQQISVPRSPLHTAESVASTSPAQALSQHAFGRAGIWALLFWAMLNGALSRLKKSRCEVVMRQLCIGNTNLIVTSLPA